MATKIITSLQCNMLLEGRVKFIDYEGNTSGSPLQGQVILYFGNNIESFLNHFNNLGICTPVQVKEPS